ncbi:MAG: hypothetical protein GX053_02575 [Tissierella sp.]|nr:hypothetical protein [Tissierella sp.]
MKDYFTKKEQIVILVVVLVSISLIGYKFILTDLIQDKEEPLEIISQNSENDDQSTINTDIEEEDKIIMIHISGQVYYPGLIELKSGSRVKDAVDLAGGLKKDADIDKINLAKKVVDEEKIYVPEKGEEISEDIIMEASSTTAQSTSNSKINLNTCTKEQLMSLPGVGEVTATKIIDYRSTNKFKTIEDIMNVSGIGTKKFEALKDFIVVN